MIRKKIINELIQSILNIRRQKKKEKENEKPEVKLGRRLEQRSYEKLSKEILEHIITRYEIDNKKLPTKENLIDLMINFLGNIQKTPDYYNLKNGKKSYYYEYFEEKLGEGANGQIYSIRPDELISKKDTKTLAFKLQEKEIPYNIDIHITSAALLAFYDFQPKYYNQYFMENGNYKKKSKERTFIKVLKSRRDSIRITKINVKWYVLFNFTNIRDQVHNLMIRSINNEFTKIDIRSFNSEHKSQKMKSNLDHIKNNERIFLENRQTILNELNKILIINEEFLLDLIIFRTRRGCFKNIDKEDLAIQIECISSSYKVIKFSYGDYFDGAFKNYINSFNNKHYNNNLALSWLLYYFSRGQILTQKDYNYYIDKFNEKAIKFEQIAKKIRSEEISINNLIKEIKDLERKKRSKSRRKSKKREETENETNTINNNDIETENNINAKDYSIKRKSSKGKDKEKSEKSRKKNFNEKENNLSESKSEQGKKFSWDCCGKESVAVIE